VCKCAEVKAYRLINAEAVKARKRAAYALRASEHRAKKLMQNYGISRDDYEAMFVAQGGRCAICGRPETSRANNGQTVKELSVDHDHATGKVRSLLCHSCNKGIGHLQDNPEIVQAAADYLRKHKEM